ncbi:MAG TPA: FAD-dependent oxidoreductase [Verrucomicrobiales bacterium]|nr:FAD-dependent oxidoreductase [Verrucomicrobiales bacterium]
MKQGRVPLFRSVVKALREAQGFSRREFIKTTAAAGAASLLPGCATTEGSKKGANITGPVAVVGGGIAGLTAAYRLMKAGVDVHLYEGSNRTGGRMYTKRGFNSEGMFCELGGELVDSNHTALIKLAKELHVDIQPLRKGEKGVDLYFINNQRYTDADLIPAFSGLALRIAADANGLLDEKEEYTAKAKRLDAMSLREYLADAGAKTDPWLIKMLDIAYLCEYGLETNRQSALNLVDFIGTDTSKGFEMFGDSDEAHRIANGNETLPLAVRAAIERRVPVRTAHVLTGIGMDGKRIRLTFQTGSGLLSQSYDHVVCAIPFTTLRRVAGWDKLPLSAGKKRVIRELTYGMNAKSMWGWKSRAWREATLPGRDVFCNGAVVTTQGYQQVWETSRGQKGSAGILTNFMGGNTAANYNQSKANDAAFLAEIAQTFPSLKGLHDGNRAVMNWPKMRWTLGSYSATGVGQYTWMYEAAAESALDGTLLFAGEHTSMESGGFMNGGVDSGERAAKELLGT